MSKTRFSFALVGLLMYLAGGLELDGATPAQVGLVLNVNCKDVWGKARSEFAVNEPVWLSLSIRNSNQTPIYFWVEAGRYNGLFCQAAKGHEAKVSIVPRDVVFDEPFRKIVLAPRQGTFVGDSLLGDFLRVSGAGSLPLNCSIDLKDKDFRPVVLEAKVRLQFKSALDEQEVKKLVDGLRKHYDSGDETTRVRMVRSAQSVPSPATIELLDKSISDKSETVQLVTLDVLSTINVPKEQVLPLLRKAAQSNREAVQQIARSIEKRITDKRD